MRSLLVYHRATISRVPRQAPRLSVLVSYPLTLHYITLDYITATLELGSGKVTAKSRCDKSSGIPELFN